MNHERISGAKSRVNLRLVLLLVFCTELYAAVPFFPTYTNSEDGTLVPKDTHFFSHLSSYIFANACHLYYFLL
jgi:hypothetical protein